MNVWQNPEPFDWHSIVESALKEDIGTGDLTSASLPEDLVVDWFIESQSAGVLAGAGIAHYLLDGELQLADGQPYEPRTPIIQGRDSARKVMQMERTALNFLMMLSGVATLTQKYVEAVEGTNARIVDTRKTVPGLRNLQKYAVRCGGGFNHRMGLYDAVMIKDNHVAAHGSISEAVKAVRAYLSHTTKIEIEVDRTDQVEEAVRAGCEIILLDNMEPAIMAAVVRAFKGKAIFEASGGINLDTVRAVAESGVDLISVGALTHSAVAVPFHLELR